MIEFNNRTPIYIQIMNYIKKKIVLQEIKGGDKLQSVREMSTELRVNPNTIQRVYKELEQEGLAYKQRGTGTFITEDKDVIYQLKEKLAKDIVNNFIKGMKELGFSNKEVVEIISSEIKGE